MSEITPVEYFFCGGFGGICTVLVGHPLDTIKVRLQTMALPKAGESPLYTSTLDCFKKTIKNEGPLGLYKGMAAPLLGVSPIFALSFMGYGVGKRLFCPPDRSCQTYTQYFTAGAFSGVFTTIIMAPGERIKCLLQIQEGSKIPKLYDGPIDVIRKLYKHSGIAAIFRGAGVTLLRDVPASGCYFMTYEAVQDYLTEHGNKKPKMLGTVFAGGLAGIGNWLVAMPADVLKSRLQSAPEGTYPNGIRDVFKNLIEKEGPLALYKGITPVLLRAFPANAACFLGFEMCKKFLRYINTCPN